MTFNIGPYFLSNISYLLPILLVLPFALLAIPEPADTLNKSTADTDGPHVFYRGDKVVVKYIVMRDTGAKAITGSRAQGRIRRPD